MIPAGFARRSLRRVAACAALAVGATSLASCATRPSPPPAPTVPSVVSAIWSADSGGLCVTLSGPVTGSVSGSNSLMPGSAFELRLSGPSLSRPIFRVPSERGRTCFELARTPAGFRALKPGPVTLDAMILGELVELATAQLDQATIDRMADISLRRGRQRTGPGGPGGAAAMEFRIDPPTVAAGETFIIHARARNTGERSIYRLRGVIEPADEQDAAVEPVEVDFGWLEPGETLELSQRRRLPRSLRADSVALRAWATELHDAEVTTPETISIGVSPLPPPALDVAIDVTPDRHGRSIREGHEGKLRPGDDLHMVLEVRNFGDSTLRGSVAHLRSPEAGTASVRVGRAVVGDLPPGATTRAHFWFVVKAPLGSGAVPMLVEITDSDLGIVHEQAVVLQIEEE